MIYKTAGTENEAIELVVRVQLLHTVEKTGYDIVAARSLTAGKDDTDIHLHRGRLIVSRLEFQIRHAVGVREEFLHFFLVGY